MADSEDNENGAAPLVHGVRVTDQKKTPAA